MTATPSTQIMEADEKAQALADDASKDLGEPVTQGLPTTGHKRRREIAGQELLRIINENTAIAHAYGLNKKIQGEP
jgi:molecular chaperone DnaK (HSP70)